MNEFRTQPLRHFDVRLTTTGEVFTKPTKLYKGSYGFITLRCFVPITQNYVEDATVPVVKVSRVITNAFGETVSDGKAYAMFFVENVNIDGYGYSLHECLMPKLFTATAGDLKMSFSYYEGMVGEDGKTTYDNLLTSDIVDAKVENGGIIADKLDVPQGDQWMGQINTNTTNISVLHESLNKTNEKIDNLTVESGTRVTENGEFVEEFDADKKASVEYVNKKLEEIPSGGTKVTVGGEVVETFDADTKVDVVTNTSNNPMFYATKAGKQTIMTVESDPTVANNGDIPQYYNNARTANIKNTTVLMTGAPTQDKHCANKQYVDDKFNGANKAIAFGEYLEMVASLNAETENPQYKVGQNIYIKMINVPDLWVSDIALVPHVYTYTSDEDIVNELMTNHSIQVGFYALSPLETQKVDLTEYAKTEDVNAGLDTKLNRLIPTGKDVIPAMYGYDSTGKYKTYAVAQWDVYVSPNYIPIYYSPEASATFSRVTGHLLTATPVKNAHAANKKYVDQRAGWKAVELGVGESWAVPTCLTSNDTPFFLDILVRTSEDLGIYVDFCVTDYDDNDELSEIVRWENFQGLSHCYVVNAYDEYNPTTNYFGNFIPFKYINNDTEKLLTSPMVVTEPRLKNVGTLPTVVYYKISEEYYE